MPLAVYLAVQATVVLASGHRAHHSVDGIVWTAVSAVSMFALALGDDAHRRSLGQPVLQTEGRVTLVDGILASGVLAGEVLTTGQPAGDGRTQRPGYVLVFFATRDTRRPTRFLRAP